MFQSKPKIWLLCIGLSGVFINSFALNQLIIKFKPSVEQTKMVAAKKLSTVQLNEILMQPLSGSQVSKLSKVAGMEVKDSHAIGTGAHVLILEKDVTKSGLNQIIDEIKKDPTVDYVVENRPVEHLSVVANTERQWNMMTASDFTSMPAWVGDNFVNAWRNYNIIGSPGSGVTIAVVDTGYTPHINFISNLQPLQDSGNIYGYQFISDCRVAGTCSPNTPDAIALSTKPQPDGLDLGDFIGSEDASSKRFKNCIGRPSSWHGSHVTGIIVANGSHGTNTQKIAGGAWGAKVIPVRVLGKCGGMMDDVIRGSMWAAGFPDRDAPLNTNPAQILNLSLGSRGECDPAIQEAVNQITSKNIAFIAAAGNDASDVTNSSPANCKNVISVSAKGPNNNLAFYSNFGATTVTASGGDGQTSQCNGLCGIYSTVWGSSQAYSRSDNPEDKSIFASYQGTSMAAPHVSAAAADIISLIKSRDGTFPSLNQVINILQNSASQLTNNCNSYGCVANKLTLNVENALAYIYNDMSLTPSQSSIVFNKVNIPVTITLTNHSKTKPVTISSIAVPLAVTNNSSSTCRTGLIVNPSGSCTMVIRANSSMPSVVAGVLQLHGTNTDMNDHKNNSSVILSTVNLSFVPAAATPSPPAPSSGGGGCTAVTNGDDFGLLLLLLSISIYTYYHRRKLNIKR